MNDQLAVPGDVVDSPEDLLLSKLVWAKQGDSELQKRDIRNLLESVRDLDFDYLRQWAKELSVHELPDELSHE
ncbi:MAG TPA: hypothetical protein VLU25_02250 [Acidobacteriota bacterium]|nr:hypothetical protein [Acidobacteriota bacterium]